MLLKWKKRRGIFHAAYALLLFYNLLCSHGIVCLLSKEDEAVGEVCGSAVSDFNEAIYLAYSASVIFGTLLFLVFKVLLIQNPPLGNL